MHTFSLQLSLVLGSSLTIAHAQPDNFFLSDSLESTLNEQVDDTSWNSVGFISSLPDLSLNPADQGETDLFSDANVPVDSMNFLDLASLPDPCGSEESSSNGPLRARDGASCASREEQVDLPLGLFEDPEKYLRDNLPTPPVGQAGQSGQGNEDGDLGFAAFMRNRIPSFSKPFNQDDQLCDSEKFHFSTTPMCSNPFMGSVDRNLDLRDSVTLTDAVPCKCFVRFFGVAIHTYLQTKMILRLGAPSHPKYGVAQ